MRYHHLILGSFLVLFFFSLPHATYAKTVDGKMAKEVKMTKEEGPVDIEADNLIYEKEADRYEAHGKVEVTRGDFSLKSDHAQLNKATKELVAWGNVLLREAEDVLECERLEVNLDTRLGKVYNARLFLKDQNFHVSGREAEKLGENHYRIRDGSFTTCDATRPPWKFAVKELDVTLKGYGKAKGPLFYFENIPVLYFPIGYFSLRTERETGFLIPRVGYSGTHGFETKNAFFWAISKDMDATLYFDYLGDRGFKEGLEYRYAFTNETKGKANVYFIDDKDFGEKRYAVFLQHAQKLPYDFYLKANINHVSDHQYTRDFDEDLPEGAKIDARSKGYLRSVLFGGKNWDQFSLLAETTVFNDLTKESNDETVQSLPQINFYAHPQGLFKTPLFYDVASSYTHFWREKGVEAHRGDFSPRVSYPFRLFNVLKLDPNIGFRETVYQTSNDPTHQLQGWKTRETFEGGVEMSTEFYKVYDGAPISKISNLYKVAKWMHTVEPTIGYSYSPRVRQSNLPLFDEVDRIPYTNQVTYGITQRLIGKPQKEGIHSGPYEYGKLMISQSYSLGDPFIDTKGERRSFSNINAEFWWNFGPYISAQSEAQFNPFEGRFDRLNLIMNVKDRRNDLFQVQYLNTRGSIKEVNFDSRVKMIGPIYLYGGMRYNILDNTKVENIYGAEYQAQCWTVALTLEDINRSPDGTQRKELKYQLFFTLKGIGSVGHRSPFMIL
jgi:LPS-assembly protein